MYDTCSENSLNVSHDVVTSGFEPEVWLSRWENELLGQDSVEYYVT